MDLTTEHILVTGASKGIGFAIADYLLQQGATVILHYNTTASGVQMLVDRYGPDRAISIKADLATAEDVHELFLNALEAVDQLQTIILNAGVFLEHPMELEWEQWFKVWRRTMTINLDSAGILTKLGIDHFKKSRDGGRFVYVGSRAVFRGETE